LFDQPAEKRYERIKVWDSCFFAGYSRMAGGLTPRLGLADRFKHRFYHKFDSFVTNYGVEACTGCGRCSEGCMGNIDLRKVLQELEKRVVLQEKIELM
jgi:ferredoxin